jgi:2-polyprenyl-3-methyl-5-hydroxy-6-metoxy-1,4-benzoquinol methylase
MDFGSANVLVRSTSGIIGLHVFRNAHSTFSPAALLSYPVPLTETNPVWSPSPQYAKVAEANRQFYARNAQAYDQTETCLKDPAAQQYLDRTLDEVLSHLDCPASELRVLDACGGTGNVALKLLHRGLHVTLTDISPEQLSIFEQKAAMHRSRLRVACAEIASFLTEHPRAFDLIVFSSALHHLENYASVLRLCLDALRPGGLVFTIHDPTAAQNRPAFARAVLRLDYFAFKCFENAADLPAALGRRFKRMRAGRQQTCDQMQINDATVGVLAEYYATRGIDDLKLVHDLREAGFEIVWHKRRAGGRYRLTRKLVAWTGEKTEFELLLRKPAQ